VSEEGQKTTKEEGRKEEEDRQEVEANNFQNLNVNLELLCFVNLTSSCSLILK